MRSRVQVLCVVASVVWAGCAGSEADAFDESLYQSLLANELSVALPTTPDRDVGAREEEMAEHIERSLQLADAVSDTFLAALHPELPAQYRDHLMGGQRVYLEGIRSGNASSQLRGTQLMLRWQDFYSANRDSILQ